MTQPREIPILFNGDMVRAILDGRKTQTRRAVKNQPPSPAYSLKWFDASPVYSLDGGAGWYWVDGWATVGPVKSPFGAPGDLLYAKETWATHEAFDDCPPRIVPPEEIVWYRTYSVGICEADGSVLRNNFHGRIRNAVHMPKWAARIWLRVNRVWVEQVQSISEDDCYEEGVKTPPGPSGFHLKPRIAYQRLWDTLYGKKFPWSDNPWVFGCEFEKVER